MSIWGKATVSGVLLFSSIAAAMPQASAVDMVGDKAKVSIGKGLDWLKAKQKENGAWSDENYPAMTALGLWAFAQSDHPDRVAVCAKAAKFVAGFAQSDGGIYRPPSGLLRKGGLSTYNTAICMTALYAYDQKAYARIILAARKFLSSNQLQGDSPGVGGFGYDRPGKGWAGRPDLSNTAWALNAMRTTQGLEDQRTSGERVDVDWAAALKYVEKLQNQDKDDPENLGGFGYARGGARGGTSTNKEGAVTLRGYGSMTYAGLESMIFAQVDRNDPRVVSALQWASRHWSVDENPGMGSKGLFYYYNIMSKALSLTGGAAISGDKGEPIPWKQQLIDKLAGTQREDGSWINKDNQFWEGDPMLVTAYTVLALQYTGKE
jgi:squalene-hopene/tetraprenyl-beta-curcumene cyclase